MILSNITTSKPIIAWWSGGVTSAVACKIVLDFIGKEKVRVVFIDTNNEDEDTYRFKNECEKWYGTKIETIRSSKFDNIKEVWYKYKSLNVNTGAICSTHLKKNVREEFQKSNQFSYQAFGFDVTEIHRAKALKLNHPDSCPIFPLLWEVIDKKASIKRIEKANDLFLSISIPRMYQWGFNNNNCGQRMCVQGGIGYWQKVGREMPNKFDEMAFVEHDLSNLKGEPVTMLKDSHGLLFLKPHPNFPHIRDISCKKGREPKPLTDCNGFCSTNDLSKRNPTEKEINFQD